MPKLFLAACTAILVLAACGSKTTTDERTAAADPQATATASVAAVGAEALPLPLTAQAFVDAVAGSDKFEIESAKIIQGAVPSNAVTQFAQMMQRDHRTSSDALKQAANAAGGTTFPDDQKLTPEQDAKLDELRSAGAGVQALYVRQQIAAHQQALATLKTYAASGDNQALMAFANKAIPVVSHHLQEVQKLTVSNSR